MPLDGYCIVYSVIMSVLPATGKTDVENVPKLSVS